MPATNSAVAVGTTAVAVATSDTQPKFVYLQDGDYDGNSLTFIGGPGVTVSNGIKLSKINVSVFQLLEYDTLHAVSTTAGGSVRVVEVF